MLAVDASPAQIADLVVGHPRVAIAAYNGPDTVVVSGDARAITEIEASLVQRGVTNQRLEVSHAFHSPLMDPIREPLARCASALSFRPPELALVSNVTGTRFSDGVVPDADYWVRHAREPVRFWQGIDAIAGRGSHLFLEIGPHPVLLGMARRFVTGDHAWIASLRRDRGDEVQLAEGRRDCVGWPEPTSGGASVYRRPTIARSICRLTRSNGSVTG